MHLELYQKKLFFEKKIILMPKSPFNQKGGFLFVFISSKLTPAQLWGNIL